MIAPTVAIATVGSVLVNRAEFAREARVARSAALVLDAILFGFISFIVNSVYGVTEVTSGFITASGGMYSTTTSVAWPWMTVLGIVYFMVPEAMFGASPGKSLMRLKVVRLDGRPLGVGSVIVRNLLKPVDFLPLLYLLGGVLVLATRGSQRLGDIAAGTTVVYRHRAPEPGATRTSSRPARLVLAGALAVALLFTVAFDYFGRPPLVMQGLFNERSLLEYEVTAYTLGSPAWGTGEVTYPIKFSTRTKFCSGTVLLKWHPFEWQLAGATYTC